MKPPFRKHAHASAAGAGPVVCPVCQTRLSEVDQLGAGDNAAVMAGLGVMQVKLRCPGCKTVLDVTLPRHYAWKSPIDIPGWGRYFAA